MPPPSAAPTPRRLPLYRAQPLEPFLFASLRNYLVEFPNQHSTIRREAVDLEDLLRFPVRLPGRYLILSPPHFHGRSSRPGWGKNHPTLRRLVPPRCLRHFRGTRTPQKEKTTLPGRPDRVCGWPTNRVAVTCPPVQGGNIRPLPFWVTRQTSPIYTMLAQSLRAALLGADCLDPETLLHFRLQAPPLNRCYYHQDRHQGRFHTGSRLMLPHTPPRKPTCWAHLRPTAWSRPAPPPLQRHQFSGLTDSTGELLHTP